MSHVDEGTLIIDGGRERSHPTHPLLQAPSGLDRTLRGTPPFCKRHGYYPSGIDGTLGVGVMLWRCDASDCLVQPNGTYLREQRTGVMVEPSSPIVLFARQCSP